MIIIRWIIELGIFQTYWVPLYLLNMLEVYVSSIFCLSKFERRKYFPLRLAFSIAISFAVCVGLGYWRMNVDDNILMRTFATFFIYASCLACMFLLFKARPTPLLLTWITILAIREMADGTDTLLKIIIGTGRTSMDYIPNAHYAINGLIFDLVHLAVQLPLGFFFGRQRNMEESKEYLPHTLILSVVLILVTVIGKTLLIQFSVESSALYSIGVSLTLIFSILILVLRTEFIRGLRKSQEIQTMEAVLLAEQCQFEESKQSIQLINAKVHDIKHKLDEFGDKVANDTLEKLKDSVRIYDRQFHTGSQVLDTILYSKSLECDRLGIRLSAIGDGSPLHYIPSSKRYYLFSNILDNAIAAVREVEDPNKRVIGITIDTKDAMTEIDAYNYFVGKRNMVHGTLQTTKKDRANHGQGLKSISYVVNEYGGTMDIRIDEDIFTLTIALPAKKKD